MLRTSEEMKCAMYSKLYARHGSQSGACYVLHLQLQVRSSLGDDQNDVGEVFCRDFVTKHTMAVGTASHPPMGTAAVFEMRT